MSDTRFYTIKTTAGEKLGWIRATTRFSAVRTWANLENLDAAGIVAVAGK